MTIKRPSSKPRSSKPKSSLERRDELIERFQPFVSNVVGHMVRQMGLPNTQFEEYVGAGYLGLVEAATRFNPKVDSDFKRYAFLRIRGSIIDAIRQTSELSGRSYRMSKAMRAAHELREEMFEEERNHVSKSKNVDQKRVELAKILNYAAKSALTTRLCFDDIGESATELQSSENPETKIEQNQEHEGIRKYLATLPEKERLVIHEYYFNDKSFSEIMEQHGGHSKSWVSRLHSRGLELLQRAILKERAQIAKESS